MRRLGDLIDDAIAPFAPGMAARRMAQRIGLSAIRQFEAAKNDRRTKGWNRPATSADRETAQGLIGLRNGARDLVRNNKYAAAAKRQMVAHMIGDGITARATHAEQAVADVAQAEWDAFAESKVYEGRHDFFHVQKLVAGAMIEGGEALQVWLPSNGVPNSRIRVLEGDYLDSTKTQRTGSGRIVQGVEFNSENDRTAYHLYREHPGDVLFGASFVSQPVDAEYVDHVYEEMRPGQTRGVSWFGAVALTLRDISDIEDAKRLKEKVAACVSLILTPGEQQSAASPLGEKKDGGAGKSDQETMRPGMIFRTGPGETVNTLMPPGTGDTVNFIRQQLGAISANLVPYHLMTGDVSQANYSSLRAALLGFWALLDDWQQQIIIPLSCQPAFDRRMRLLALQTGNRKFLQVKAQWAVPNRGFVDPVKDLMGEILAIRSGLTSLTHALSKRGIDVSKHLAELARINALIDQYGLALDSDPRRVTAAGILQAATGYLAPKGEENTTTN